MLRLVLVLLLAGVAVAFWPRGDDEPPPRPQSAARGGERAERPLAERRSRERRPLPRPLCPGGVPDCAVVSGRIVYVERVDPDGDGDLHVVVTDRRGVTLSGLTAIDVPKHLRPRRDPRAGDRASAAGPVQTGSFGQSQIHALEFHVRRR